jgi:hypothetical protein
VPYDEKNSMNDSNAAATKGDIQELRAELKGDMQELRAATKGDIQELRAELKDDIQQLRSEMNHQYNDVVERIADNETKLLQAFYTYAESNQKRVAAVEVESAGLKNRLSTIEERLTDVEKRLNMPPHQ